MTTQDSVVERFEGRAGARWRRYAVGSGDLAITGDGLRLEVANANAEQLSVAQLDEGQYALTGGRGWRPPLRLTIEARWSHPASELAGTSGFGFWNDPWGPEGFSTAPAWVWFAHYSPPSHVALDVSGYGQGPRAAVLAAPRVGRLGLALGNVVLRLPGAARLAVAAASRTVAAADLPLTNDLRAWHTYTLEWTARGIRFSVDDQPLGQTAAAPRGPLTFVAWMDNQWAALRPDGTAGGGYLAVPQAQWLELRQITITPLAAEEPALSRQAPREPVRRADDGKPVQYYVAERGRLSDAALALLAARGALLGHARWRQQPLYRRWHDQVMTKVVLAGTADEVAAIRADDPEAVALSEAGEPAPPDAAAALLVLPPRPRPPAGSLLASLRLAPKVRGSAPEPETNQPALLLLAANDLGMHGGKLAAQCAHAILLAQRAYGRDSAWRTWEAAGRPMALRGLPSAQLVALAARFPGGAVHDAGHTQVAAGSLTVVAIPPGVEEADTLRHELPAW